MSSLTPAQEALRALAAKATPGPWECRDHPEAPFDGEFRVLGPFFASHIPGKTFDDRHWIAFLKSYDNAAFIAAANPAAVLALLDELAAARAALREISELDFGAVGDIARAHLADGGQARKEG